MHAEYTPEEIRTLLDEHETLEYASATDDDVLDAADVLEGVEALVCKLGPEVRRDELLLSSLPAGEHFYVPVIRNCSRGAGVAIDPEVAVVTVKRGNNTGRVWLRDLYANPRNDVALRPGDVILVEEDQRSFTSLGALGGQTKVPLGSEQINAIEAIAMVGGLSSNLADPTGVFVLRDEPMSAVRPMTVVVGARADEAEEDVLTMAAVEEDVLAMAAVCQWTAEVLRALMKSGEEGR